MVQSEAGNHVLADIFQKEISGAKRLRILLFAHRQADPDALCAAGGLLRLLKQGFKKTELEPSIIAPQGASVLGSRVCQSYSIDFVEKIDPSEIKMSDMIVILDAGEPTLLEPFLDAIRSSRASRIVIDHHTSTLGEPSDNWKGFEHVFIDPNSTSTCEIITHGFPKELLTAETARILLAGLMFDSQHLGLANASTLEAALKLVRAGAQIDAAKSVLRGKQDRSEVIARVKSAQRLQFVEVGGYVILKTEVSSFHASVARMLLEIGGDVGIAYGETEDGEARISVRSSQRFFKATGIDLGEELNKLAKRFGVTGGGHSTAAAFSGNTKASSAAELFAESLAARILKC